MINRIALVAGSAAAALTLAVALAAAGFIPKTPASATPASAGSPIDPAADGATAAPSVLVDTIYLAPPAEPQTVTVTQSGGGTASGDEDGEHESGDDD